MASITDPTTYPLVVEGDYDEPTVLARSVAVYVVAGYLD